MRTLISQSLWGIIELPVLSLIVPDGDRLRSNAGTLMQGRCA